jgi:hypothetical protein
LQRAYFAIPDSGPGVKGNVVLKPARDRMNDLVDSVYIEMQRLFVAPHADQVFFINTDGQFEGCRFCEQSTDNPVPGDLGDNENVWFISFVTDLNESELVVGSTEEEQNTRDVL